MARITLTDRLVRNRVNERSAFNIVASFFDDSSAATDVWSVSAPTSARYRIDNPSNGTEVLGWTTLTPATTNTIAITADQNAIVHGCHEERRQITVQANTGLATQFQATRDWWVEDLVGQS